MVSFCTCRWQYLAFSSLWVTCVAKRHFLSLSCQALPFPSTNCSPVLPTRVFLLKRHSRPDNVSLNALIKRLQCKYTCWRVVLRVFTFDSVRTHSTRVYRFTLFCGDDIERDLLTDMNLARNLFFKPFASCALRWKELSRAAQAQMPLWALSLFHINHRSRQYSYTV